MAQSTHFSNLLDFYKANPYKADFSSTAFGFTDCRSYPGCYNCPIRPIEPCTLSSSHRDFQTLLTFLQTNYPEAFL